MPKEPVYKDKKLSTVYSTEKISSRFDEANAIKDQIQNLVSEIQEEIKKSSSDKEVQAAYRKLMNYGSDHPDEVNRIQDGLTGFNKISKEEMISEFGDEKGELLLSLFSLRREERDFKYYNQKNPFIEKPLCWLDDEKLFLVSPVILLSSILDYITNIIENEDNSFSSKYKKKKADIVETEFLKCFHDIFGDSAIYHRSVCETPGSSEHDILIEFGSAIIIAEAKASKVHEPFFNPERSYTRIERHFFSNNGIGYAYNQAIALKKVLEAKDSVTLYEDMKNPFEIEGLNVGRRIESGGSGELFTA